MCAIVYRTMRYRNVYYIRYILYNKYTNFIIDIICHHSFVKYSIFDFIVDANEILCINILVLSIIQFITKEIES